MLVLQLPDEPGWERHPSAAIILGSLHSAWPDHIQGAGGDGFAQGVFGHQRVVALVFGLDIDDDQMVEATVILEI